jgi:hypothetical protein
MSAYLLTCVCGKTVPVDIGQAGGRVTCSCGTQLEVPTLRQLRQLPQEQTAEVRRPKSAWGTRQGIEAVSLIGAALLLAWSGWIWWTEPTLPKFDPAARMEAVEQQLKTPAKAWELWIGYYRPLAERGFPIFRVGNMAEIENARREARFLRFMLWAVAAILLIVAISTMFWPRPQPRLAATRREAPRP